MASFAPTDLIALAVRLVFVALLYGVVVAVLRALRGDLVRARTATRPADVQVRLILIEGSPADGPPGRTVALSDHSTIGRHAECDVVLRDDSVSSRHARFVEKEQWWEVEDLGSTNGTFLNGRRLTQPAPLQTGDVVTTGIAAWRFEALDR